MKDELIIFIKKAGYEITNEVDMAIEQLAEILVAEKKADISHVIKWLEEKRQNHHKVVEEIGIKNLDNWKTDPETGNIVHVSGKFFQIVGIKVEGAKDREVLSWTQPIMKQHECGI